MVPKLISQSSCSRCTNNDDNDHVPRLTEWQDLRCHIGTAGLRRDPTLRPVAFELLMLMARFLCPESEP
jgi:hypothetical protein